MYLQSIELIGFKSFAHKTLLNFHRGVTGIVGPNGCGKSNVLDAIRWALGETSAKTLRGRSMSDLIFSGCSSRGPKGLAEVTLTFSNTDGTLPQYPNFSEVAVTRRLYRD